MENKIILVHDIEPETKLNKLDEELDELYIAFKLYKNNNNILPLLRELADVCIIILGIAIVKHGLNIKEFKSIVDEKLNRSLRIKKRMKEEGKTYDQVRRM